MNFQKYFIFLMAAGSAFVGSSATTRADDNQGLIVHAAEIGIGKFHRYDNKVHPYEHNNIWLNYVAPEGDNLKTPIVRANDDGSVTVFYSTLEEMLQSVQKISAEKQAKVSVLNINAHGMPGAMWFPKDEKTMKSSSCSDWVNSANGADKGNYDQYYSPVSKADIIQMRMLAKLPSAQWMAPCTTGAKQWVEILKRNPKVLTAFASDAQLHFFSCIVGLGRAGKNFMTKVAAALFSGDGAKVEASMNFGLGDWSMPEGMGFWDYLNDDQLNRDNEHYPVDRKDRDLMQKGQVRVVMNQGKTQIEGVVPNVDFMLGTKDSLVASAQGFYKEPEDLISKEEYLQIKEHGLSVRIPGTNVRVPVRVEN